MRPNNRKSPAVTWLISADRHRLIVCLCAHNQIWLVRKKTFAVIQSVTSIRSFTVQFDVWSIAIGRCPSPAYLAMADAQIGVWRAFSAFFALICISFTLHRFERIPILVGFSPKRPPSPSFHATHYKVISQGGSRVVFICIFFCLLSFGRLLVLSKASFTTSQLTATLHHSWRLTRTICRTMCFELTVKIQLAHCTSRPSDACTIARQGSNNTLDWTWIRTILFNYLALFGLFVCRDFVLYPE